ncbi:acetate kinase [Romeria aff. gracilis LEGE 07310]|uniref:Acetate kinase n=1 Tax=Vasconcelosia minhoensis LEGE 07310 TaxID=915328 RepID=A0A8J7DQ28_9CYAN|nr:acetate kinase [Romeria gracilis]MBE9075799.1 acetate kinase [Romeria aff. gracilis LEGE 07310]
MKILVLNAGSSSHKCRLYELNQQNRDPAPPLWQGQLDWTHQPGQVELSVETAEGKSQQTAVETTDRTEGLKALLETLIEGPTAVIEALGEIDAVGHRVVHGGEDYQQSVVIDAAVKDAIASLAPLAPAHNPVNLQGIEAIEKLLGNVPQVAVFDTAFHAQMPEAAATYPGPYDWLDQGIRRYGFHGTSHQYCAERVAQLQGADLADLRLITCHLGNGCSLAAIRQGRSVDTTMGFTPLDGLMMGSRSGAVDPSILIYLQRQQGYTPDQLDQLLNKESGLKGLSGISNDLRAVSEAKSKGNPRAQLAYDVFIHRLRRGIGSMLASLGGLDALVFTGGIGEHSPPVRQAACEAFGFLNLQLDAQANQHTDEYRDIATAESAVRIWAIHTQEEWAIAQDCLRLL